jgi:serine/threonine-protein kinase
MLTGRAPFGGNSIAEIYGAMLVESPAPIAAGRSDVPGALEAVVMRCLQKQPADRYAHAGELGAALAAFAQPSTASSGALAPASAPAQRVGDAMRGTGVAAGLAVALAATAPSYGSGPGPVAGWPPAGAPVAYGTGGWQTAPSAMAFAPAPVAVRPRRWPWVVGALVIGSGLTAAVALFVGMGSGTDGARGPASSAASRETRAPEPSPVPAPSADPTSIPGRGGTKLGPGAGGPGAQTGKTGSPSPGAPATAAATPSVAPPSGRAAGALRQVALSCWSTAEGAKKGQPADNATITLTVAPSGSRSVLVNGAAGAKGFRACVVSGAGGIPVDTGESPVQVSVALKAGPP